MRLLRESYRGTLLVCGGFDRDSGEQWLREGRADAVAYGRHFLANPDLPERLREGAALNPDDRATYYGGGEHGYTDYPTLAHLRGSAPPRPASMNAGGRSARQARHRSLLDFTLRRCDPDGTVRLHIGDTAHGAQAL